MTQHNMLGEWAGNSLAVVFTAIQPNQIFQIISLVLTILSILTTTAFTIYKWHKTAKEDGKITKEELEELLKIGGETAQQIIDAVDEYNQGKKEGE